MIYEKTRVTAYLYDFGIGNIQAGVKLESSWNYETVP
jgi:hypothetical protein